MHSTWWSNALLVGAGGFVGSTLRYGLSGLVHQVIRSQSFPYGTLVVNVMGCLAIGTLGGLAEARSVLGPSTRLFLLIGLLGGFTTFSTFGFETLMLARGGDVWRAGANTLGHVAVGFVAVWIGLVVARAW